MEFGDPAEQADDPIAGADVEPLEGIGEPVGQRPQLAIADVPPAPVAGLGPEGHLPGAGPGGVPVHRFVGDVQPGTAGQAIQVRPDGVPGEPPRGGGIVLEIGPGGPGRTGRDPVGASGAQLPVAARISGGMPSSISLN